MRSVTGRAAAWRRARAVPGAWLVAIATLAVLAAGCGRARVAPPAAAPRSLDATLRPYLARYGLPALAAAVVQDGRIVAVGAVGTRRAGAAIPVTTADRFHIGSDTKAMTALVAATFVEQGKLRWDTRVAEVFPELAPKMKRGLGAVTLEQLLSHTSGIPSDNATFGWLLDEAATRDGNLDELRYWLVSRWSNERLASRPGTAFAYSNMGYVVAGAMLERVGGKTWEELVRERVFDPLGLASAGFGPQATLGRIDAPLGHELQRGKPKPMLAGPNGDNPLLLGPAGTVHLSVLDFAAWAGWNAGEGKRGPAIVRPETLKKLHTPVVTVRRPNAAPGTPPTGRYALGWGEVTLPASPEPFVFHGGSNEKNLAFILLQPRHDFAMVLMTNVAGTQADAALKALVTDLYRTYGSARTSGARGPTAERSADGTSSRARAPAAGRVTSDAGASASARRTRPRAAARSSAAAAPAWYQRSRARAALRERPAAAAASGSA
jgi:CubicO group peptidase (beta-lactamase class C family)